MKKRKLVTVFLFMMMLLFGLPVGASAKTSIKLNTKSKTIAAGKTYTVKATVKGTKKKVVWTSSNTSVATVNKSGKVTAKKAGKSVIRAKVNGKTAKCTITVKAPNYAKRWIYRKEHIVLDKSEKDSDWANPMDCLIVLKISGGKIKFVVEHFGLYGSPIYQTNTITAKLNGNKTSTFKWNDGWGNSGTGRLIFMNKEVTVKMKVTEEGLINRWLWNRSITLPYTKDKLSVREREYYADIRY